MDVIMYSALIAKLISVGNVWNNSKKAVIAWSIWLKSAEGSLISDEDDLYLNISANFGIILKSIWI
jgi:hypothetical protein